MYSASNYINRGLRFLNNQWFPKRKKISTLMIYGTDLCDSACKHCLIWTKRPVNYLPFDKIKEIMTSRCITRNTTIGLEGGEFLLHPDANDIMAWFHEHHKNFDLLTNALKPENVIEAIKAGPPRRLYISVDGDRDSYLHMRGKDGYDGIIDVIEKTHKKVPISIMFTLSPYNDFSDMKHVAELAKKYGIDMRIGVYNDISFFDTIESAHFNDIGSLKSDEIRSFNEAKKMVHSRSQQVDTLMPPKVTTEQLINIRERIPDIIKEFPENFDFLVLYDEWRKGNLKLNCYSILDSIVILPNGDVPICQNLNVMIGNVFTNSLDEIFNGAEAREKQKHYSRNCNACWINFHRKYDVILYRTFEKYFGHFATRKMLGKYWWEKEKKKSYKQVIAQ
ncbi:MAG TPA: radical SAM protein [Chitinophagaceae bacterium]|nr:radical SAM protein [Chitinophagaceae bacterium]